MTTKLVTTVLFLCFVASPVFAECSKKEILQFIELGFSKKEIKQICKDDSITFGEDLDKSEEPNEIIGKPVEIEGGAKEDTNEIQASENPEEESSLQAFINVAEKNPGTVFPLGKPDDHKNQIDALKKFKNGQMSYAEMRYHCG